MPTLNEANIRHLLRRTEFVDRPSRVTELLALGSIAAAVDNILNVPASPPSVVFRSGDEDWQRGQHLAHFWLDRMANDSSKPMQEKMALFWHGHLVSDISKVADASVMREQIDLYRSAGLGNIRALVQTMSLQVAMLRYLDNNENEAESPNQNFARELMELFLLEVGNYTEADVEAATAAWSGHSDNWENGDYVWNAEYHDGSTKQFLGQTINAGSNGRLHGPETIDVILGNGTIPATADKTENRGRDTRDVAAEFLSRKLWIDFADSAPPAAVINAMRGALVAADFDALPWVRTMLNRDEFYSEAVKTGLVRSPIDWVVSMLYSIDAPSEDATSLWLMGGTGQELLYPPNVSGWKTNGYFVNASAMESRARMCQGFNWHARREYWREDGTGFVRLRGGSITQAELIARVDGTPVMSSTEVVDQMVALMDLQLRPDTRQRLIDYVSAGSVWDRHNVLLLILLAPELHVA